MPSSPGNNLQRTNASGLSPATSNSSLGAAQAQQQHQQQQQQVQRPRAPPSISSSISSDRPPKPSRAVSFTPEVSRAQAGTASLADFLRSTGPDPLPIAPLPTPLPPQQLQPNPPALAFSSIGKKSGGGIFNLGRKKTATRTSSDAGGGASSSSSAGGASMASGGIANVRGVETVVTASGQTVNIIPYKPPHLPPLAGSESLDSITPTPSTQQDLYRISGHPYLSSSSSPSTPPERSPARVPRSGSQGALDLLSQAREDARAADASSSRASGAGMRRSETTPNIAIQSSSPSPSRQPPQSSFSQSQLAPPNVSSPPQAQAPRRPATASGSPSASPSRAAGGASPHRPPRTPPTSRRPSTAPDEPTQQFATRKISSPGPSVPAAAVLSASIVLQQHQSSSSYTPHSIHVGRADSPTDPTLSPPVQPVPLGSQLSDDGRGGGERGELVALVDSRQQRIQEQVSMLELLGQRIEADEDWNVMVGRRVERRHIAVQVGTSVPASSLKRAEPGDETTKGERKTHLSGASSSSTSMKDGNDNSKTPTITSSLALAAGDRGPDSSPEMFSTPTGSSEGTFVSTHSTHSGESLLASGGNTTVTTAPTTASSSTTSTPLTASTFATTTSSSTGTSASTSTTHPPPPALPPSRSVAQKSSLSPPSLARPSGGYGSSGVLAKKSSSRPQTSPELSTRGVFGETSNPASLSSSTVVATTQEEKDRERRLAYLEEKVKREVERRKDAEGAMRRLNQATAEQKGRWEDMAGWALDVMERTERERTLLRSDNAKLRRELELWKMKAQVAESGQHMDRSRRLEGSGVSSGAEGEGEGEEESSY